MRRPSRLKDLWNKSQTKLWAKAQLAGSAALASISSINKFVSNDTFKSYLDQLDVPKSVIVALAVLGLVTYIVHGHGDD